MAHVPGHLDESLLAAGQAGTELPARRNPRVQPRPSVFDPSAQNLFGEIELGARGRRGDLLGTLIGGFLPPSKKQRTAFAKLIEQRKEKAARAREGALSEFAEAAGISRPAAEAAASFPAAAAALEQFAQQEPGGAGALGALAARGPKPVAAAKVALDTAEQQLINARQQGVDQILNREGQLNTRFLKSIAETSEIVLGTQQLTQLLDQDTALASLGAVIKLAKLLDPGSVVREGEVTTVAGGSGLAATLINEWEKMKGAGFGENSVQQFRGVVQALAGPQAVRGQSIISDFTDLANRAGIPISAALAGSGIDPSVLNALAQGTLPGRSIPFSSLPEIGPIEQTPSSGPIQRFPAPFRRDPVTGERIQ